jgi:endonuclease-3
VTPRVAASAAGAPPRKRKPAAGKRARKPADPVRHWASYLRRYRPGLQRYVLDGLAGQYGEQHWEARLDPTSELILTILTQNTADVNAEKAYEALRRAYPSDRTPEEHHPGIGWGGGGLSTAPPPDWSAVEHAPLPELVDVIRPGGLAPQKAPRLQATLRHIREQRGDYSLEFLGELPALEARDWLTSIDGIGKKTASIVLAFCFGMPVMAVDRHVERVSKRIGLIPAKATADQAHDLFLGLLEPDEMYAAHVLLIHHGRAICQAQNPKHDICPVRDRCRMVDRKAP